MARHIIRRSKMMSDKVKYEWIISDFSVEDLLEGAIGSPSFRCFNRDFHLELSHSAEGSGRVLLRLIHSGSDDPPRIKLCDIGYYCSSPSVEWICNSFAAPVKATDISCSVSVAKMKEECLADNELRVECHFKTSKLEHTLEDQLKTKTTENKKTLLNQGHTTLAVNFGDILDSSPFFDVNLKVGEETIPAHKAILAGRSTVFEGMFKSDMKESHQNVVEISEMKPATAKKMLQYIYTGAIGDLSVDAAMDLYVGSDQYDLQELKGWCKEYILEHISSDDVCRVAVIADLHSDKDLAEASRRVFMEDPKKIVGSAAWGDFGKTYPSLQLDLLEKALINEDKIKILFSPFP